jgi:hypothetical protein
MNLGFFFFSRVPSLSLISFFSFLLHFLPLLSLHFLILLADDYFLWLKKGLGLQLVIEIQKRAKIEVEISCTHFDGTEYNSLAVKIFVKLKRESKKERMQ